MNELKSKRWFAIECGVIIAPYALLGILAFGSVASSVSSAKTLPEGAGALFCTAIIGILLSSGVYLSVAFLRGGRQALLRIHRAWWLAMYSIALIPISGLCALLVVRHFGDFPLWAKPANSVVDNPHRAMASYLGAGMLLVPLLLPMIHLYIEKRSGLRSTKSLNKDVQKDGAPVG